MTKEEFEKSLASDSGYAKDVNKPVNNMPESRPDRVAPTPGDSSGCSSMQYLQPIVLCL